MKILGHTVARMYVSVIVLLTLLAGASAYLLGEFPYALILSVLACMAIELAIRKFYLGHAFRIPFSAMITGLIIGCVAPINVPLLPVLVACAAAIASKFLIKAKHSNIFNPAAVGLLALALLSIGSSWWATTSVTVYGIAISLSLVLIIAAYEARRLYLAFAFIITSVLLSIAGSLPVTSGSITIALLSVNYFFAFLMVTDPKTSPPKRNAQIAYGIYLAVIYLVLILILPSKLYLANMAIFLALLLGNASYLMWRKFESSRASPAAFSSKAPHHSGG